MNASIIINKKIVRPDTQTKIKQKQKKNNALKKNAKKEK